MVPTSTRQVVLASRPVGIPQAEHFELRNSRLPSLQDGQILVRNSYLSADPAMRGWVNESANYSEPVPVGAVMRALAVGEVIDSRNPNYRRGELVTGLFGWQDVALVEPAAIWRKVTEADLPPSLSLGVLGLPGFTAWAGLHRILRPRTGGTLVVSTAAGAVGSTVGQLAARLGCRTVGIAGGPAKAAACVEEFGFDVGLDYRSTRFEDDLRAATPDGVDAYFDNTSGPITDAVTRRLAPRAAVLVCGTASIQSWDPVPTGPRVERALLTKRARMEGFLALDHFDAFEEAISELASLVRTGALAYREHTLHGLESAPGSIAMLYSGENTGKLVIQVE